MDRIAANARNQPPSATSSPVHKWQFDRYLRFRRRSRVGGGSSGSGTPPVPGGTLVGTPIRHPSQATGCSTRTRLGAWRGQVRVGRTADQTSPCFLSRFASVSGAETAREVSLSKLFSSRSWALALFAKLDGSTLRQRASGAETTPSRSPGAGLVVGMRENAGLALIRPVEASALVGGASPTWNSEYRRLRIMASNAGPPYAPLSFPFF